MIFRSVVSAMVVVAIASAAVITVPKYTTTTAKIGIIMGDPETTVRPADTITTMKPADNITNVKLTDNFATVASADNITTVKPEAPTPTQAPMLTCYCNLPECLVAAGGDGTCSTRLGCYSEVLPIIPRIGEEIMTPAKTESIKTSNGSAVSPIISELDNAPVAVTTEHAAAIRGSFGCLDTLNFAKQSCDEILKSMEAEASEFPIIQVPTNGAAPSATDNGIHAFHCCQTERCNGNQSGPAEGSVKSAQAVLVAELKNTVVALQEFPLEVQNSTMEVQGTPIVESSVNNTDISNSTSLLNNTPKSDNIDLSNVEKINASTPDLWHTYFSMGEPKAPSALKSDNSFENATFVDATTPAIPAAMPPTLPVAVPDNQEITHDDHPSHVEHVVSKRHDGPKAVPVLKQNIDDQENIPDFDDDIAALVEASLVPFPTKKLPVRVEQISAVTYPSTVNTDPKHGGVPDFSSPPVLKKNITTKSFSSVRGVSNNSNHFNIHVDDNDSYLNNRTIGIACAIFVGSVISLAVLLMFVIRKIVRKTDVINNYKGVCSNPGQLCACKGGFTRHRPRTQPSSTHPRAAAAAVNRNATTAPLLPPPNPGHNNRGHMNRSQMNRGHANPGAFYNDSIGDTTYVYTPIPVNNDVAPVMVVRR